MNYLISAITKLIKWLIVILICIAASTAILLMCSCQTAPDKESFVSDDCFAFADCMYRIRKGEDKAACAVLAEACRDSLKERRMYQRLEYCRSKCPQGMSESECRLYLNQK